MAFKCFQSFTNNTQIYDHIEAAEQLSRERNYQSAVKEYEHALTDLQALEKQLGTNGKLKHAMILLREDIQIKIKELEQWELRQPSAGLGAGLSPNRKNSPVRGPEATSHLSNGVPIADPFLASIINKLQTNILQTLSQRLAGEGKPMGKQELEAVVSPQMTQFQKEMTVFEQRKFREYDSKMDQLLKENRKLSNQVIRLKDRWDSLVESAKQKRNQQERQ